MVLPGLPGLPIFLSDCCFELAAAVSEVDFGFVRRSLKDERGFVVALSSAASSTTFCFFVGLELRAVEEAEQVSSALASWQLAFLSCTLLRMWRLRREWARILACRCCLLVRLDSSLLPSLGHIRCSGLLLWALAIWTGLALLTSAIEVARPGSPTLFQLTSLDHCDRSDLALILL